MILKSFSKLSCLFIIFLFFLPLTGEEKIDIWKNNKEKEKTITDSPALSEDSKKLNFKPIKKIRINQEIKIENELIDKSEEKKVFGIYDPENYNFNLDMWSSTNADDIRASIKRLKKMKLSNTSNELFENILFSFAYPPPGMEEKEFLKLKIDWLIANNRTQLIEEFLRQNQEFDGKSKAVQYLVDESISQANIKEGCNKIKFIDASIKDSYLEKFKIYCLVFNNNEPQAQLLLDLLREEKKSDKFFDDKINFILGISNKTSKKINEKNLLNFYLSSVTITNFEYETTQKTKKEIWKYLNAANLIKIEDVNDKKKIKELEMAADQNQINKEIIFEIYKQIPFSLNNLINAKNVYQTLDGIESKALIYQKFLLSEDIDTKVEYLFLLEELFKKDKTQNIFAKFLSDNLQKIGLDNIPNDYKEIAQKRILSEDEIKIGKIRYNDKVLHQSKIIKYFIEKEDKKKIQKDLNKILKKISKNRKYFYSAKDLALIESLIKDGFEIPSNFNYQDQVKKYDVPKNLLQLIENDQSAFLALKIVEIIGEDEPYQLDPETIYFITNLLNKTNLISIRDRVLTSSLPQRI